MKKCTKCEKEYPETPEYFYQDSQTRSRLKPVCKVCCREYDRQRKIRLKGIVRVRDTVAERHVREAKNFIRLYG